MWNLPKCLLSADFALNYWQQSTLESGIDVGQGINVGPGKFVKKNKHKAMNKRRVSEF